MNAVPVDTAPAVRERHLALAEVRAFLAQLASGLERFGLNTSQEGRRLADRLSNIERFLVGLN
jgi:hypothetical protein